MVSLTIKVNLFVQNRLLVKAKFEDDPQTSAPGIPRFS